MSGGETPINWSDDVIDSRDVIARIEYLQNQWDEGAEEDHSDYSLSEDDWAVQLGEEDARELVALMELAEEASSTADWTYGETLISDDHFEDYARQLAEDIGAINRDAEWPLSYIDWSAAADALKVDYFSVEYAGQTFWVRG